MVLTDTDIAPRPQGPWWQPYARWITCGGPWRDESPEHWIARLDQQAQRVSPAPQLPGGPLRFVAQVPQPAATGAAAYESGIAASGQVPMRMVADGAVHDYFNALCWLRWPATKARLNALHVAALQERAVQHDPAVGSATRGRLRDALTLFDEHGAVLLCSDPLLVAAWQAMDWRELFVQRREAFRVKARVFVLGHGLLQKLMRPYKSICAQALAIETPIAFDDASAPWAQPGSGALSCAPWPLEPDELLIRAVDLAVASALDEGFSPQRLAPLPLAGVPGWCAASEDPAFYNDPQVFRSRRRPSSAGSLSISQEQQR